MTYMHWRLHSVTFRDEGEYVGILPNDCRPNTADENNVSQVGYATIVIYI